MLDGLICCFSNGWSPVVVYTDVFTEAGLIASGSSPVVFEADVCMGNG